MSDEGGDKRYLLSKGNSPKGQLLAALAVFNRAETMCGVVLLQLLLCVFLLLFAFSTPICSHFCNGTRLNFSTIRKPGKTIFFTKENF